MPQTLKAAVIQMNAGQDRIQNLAKAVQFTTQAIQSGAQFIALPEVFNYRGTAYIGETSSGPSIEPLIALASSHNVWILAGSICEVSPNPSKFFNTSILIGPHGIHANYRKIHLFDAEVGGQAIQESLAFVHGNTPTLTTVMDIPLGMAICYDLRFSNLFERYARQGAKILTIPASFTATTGRSHWEPLLRARAIETQCFVIAPNQVGLGTRDVLTYGHSMIIDPWGRILVEGDETQEGPLYATLDFAELDRIRETLPIHLHRNQL